MKNLYLILAILGFIIPNSLVFIESIDTGNILLYLDPIHTFQQMFANRISSIFAIDLLLVVAFFFLWSYQQRQGLGNKLYFTWLCTMLFGLAFGFPLFLYFKAQLASKHQ